MRLEIWEGLLREFREKQDYYYGKHAGFAAARELLLDAITEAKITMDIFYADLVEPSDPERASLPPTTRKYIEDIESILPEVKKNETGA